MKRSELPSFDLLSDSDVLDIFRGENLRLATEFDSKGLSWEEMQKKDTNGTDHEKIWALMLALRELRAIRFRIGGIRLNYHPTEGILRMLHKIDRESSGNISRASEKKAARMLAAGPMTEEAIASSRLHGPAISARAARAMLRSGRRPTDGQETTVQNTYNALLFVKENRNEKLTPKMISRIHAMLTDGVEGNEKGFRTDDTVQDTDQEAFCAPPASKLIPKMIDALCRFANSDRPFVHPLVKALVIRLFVSCICPFPAANGRLARALMYWFALKAGYWMFEYIAVSKVTEDDRKQVEGVSEKEDNDVTSYIMSGLRDTDKALDAFMRQLDKKIDEQNADPMSLEGLGLTERQASIVRDAAASGKPFTVSSISEVHHVTYQTAAKDIAKLESLDLVKKQGKDRNRILYAASDLGVVREQTPYTQKTAGTKRKKKNKKKK